MVPFRRMRGLKANITKASLYSNANVWGHCGFGYQTTVFGKDENKISTSMKNNNRQDCQLTDIHVAGNFTC